MSGKFEMNRRTFPLVVTLGVGCLGGCSATRSGHSPPTSVPLPASAHPTGPKDELPCKGDVQLIAPDTDAVCEEATKFWPGSCQVPLRFVVCNGSSSPIEPRSLRLGDGHPLIEWTFDQRTVAPGESFTHRYDGWVRPGTYELVLIYEAQGTSRERRERLRVTNTARAAAEQACRACNGRFGARGMLSIEVCSCRMNDAGKPCDDGNDCEGKCVGRDGAFTCSEFDAVFGCHGYLPDGWSKGSSSEARRVPYVCTD